MQNAQGTQNPLPECSAAGRGICPSGVTGRYPSFLAPLKFVTGCCSATLPATRRSFRRRDSLPTARCRLCGCLWHEARAEAEERLGMVRRERGRCEAEVH